MPASESPLAPLANGCLLAFAPWEVHPSLVHFPIAFLLGGVALDLYAWCRQWQGRRAGGRSDAWVGLAQIATGMIAAGVATGVLAAIAGAVAYWTVPVYVASGETLMKWHLGTELASLALFAWTAFIRWQDRDQFPSLPIRLLGLVAATGLVAASYLGGYLVYHFGVGIASLASPS